MSLTFSTQAVIAFKNLNSKSHTDNVKDIINESEGISFNITGDNIWLNNISTTASTILQGNAIRITADLALDPNSNGHSYDAKWPSVLPTDQIDVKTGTTYSYGAGSLIGISAGNRVRNSISDSYGTDYQAIPIDNTSATIPLVDPRSWFYQYNSGVFYQEILIGNATSKIKLYVYIGPNLNSLSGNSPTNIRLTALGTDSYYATFSTPMISTYSSNYLYLVDFVNSNTSGTVSLNINGIGTQSIYTFDQSGQINLSIGDITGATGSTAGPLYYLTFNNNSFQLYTTNPISSPITYTNPNPVPITIGGISAGTTFSNVSMQQMWTSLLYPYMTPSITSFNISGLSTTREVGATISSGSYTFLWSTSYSGNILPNTTIIDDITSSTNLITGTANDGTAALSISTITNSSPGSHTWGISMTITNLSTISANFSVYWYWRMFYGNSTNTTLTGVQAQSLSGSSLTSTFLGTYTYAGGGYKYFVIPDSFPNVNLFRDFNTNLAVAMSDSSDGYSTVRGSYTCLLVNITNVNNVTTSYRIYRSKNILNGSINIIVT